VRLEELLGVGMDWINLAWDRNNWRVVVDTAMKFSVFPYYMLHR
jgi:hypothetical protein